jgi:hypothetical protein
MEVGEEADERGFSDVEYAAYAYLHDECDLPEDEAHRVAESLCEALTEDVDTDFPGFGSNQKTLREIKKLLYKTLARANTPEDLDLMTAGSELRDYLIASHVDDAHR